MCGIFGVINQKLSSSQVTDKLNLIAHRGPDDKGTWQDDHIWLGHVRLSIQDLSQAAHQPMKSADGRYIIIYNGELYNHWDIRKQLEAKGCIFRSTSDTETLLQAYIAYGKDCLQMLNGIFAFAVYDNAEKKLFVARDQFGVKPLYYYYDGNTFMFSSELKTLLGFPQMDYSIDATVLYDYMLFLWSPTVKTPFKNIQRLDAAHYAEIDVEHISSFNPQRYYTIPFNGKYISNTSFEDGVAVLDEVLTSAVDRQMLSDVPVGFFLSGGLDSSLICAIAHKLHPDAKQKCYTIDTGDIGKTEGFATDLPYARKMAQHLNADLEVVKADIDVVRDFDKMIWHLEEPQADAAPINVLNIASMAVQQGYKVLLGGTAGDDVFSGYRRHKALSIEKYIQAVPSPLRKSADKIIDLLPNTPRTRRIKKITENLDKTAAQRMAGYFFWLPQRLEQLFVKDLRPQIGLQKEYHFFNSLLAEIPAEQNALNQMLYWEMRTFLPNHNLNYTDKMSMAVGVEARVPFLDKELVEFSTTLPPEWKMQGRETKYILKKLAEKYLPHDVIYRPKTGFIAPIRTWLKGEMKQVVKEKLLSEDFTSWGIFDKKEIEKLIADNDADRVDAAYTIWSLLAIESWLRQFAS